MRSAFLRQACADDPALRSEAGSLIASHDQAGDSIEAMAADAATERLADDRQIAGQQIGRYQVLSLISNYCAFSLVTTEADIWLMNLE